MVDYVDLQYVNFLCSNYPRFSVKHKTPLKVNFRCPICGDSKKSKTKARGWVTENPKTAMLFYKCFNCGASQTFEKFLKDQNPSLHKKYLADKFLKNKPKPDKKDTEIKNPEVPSFTGNFLKKIKKISQLDHNHPAKKYIDSRQIPTDQHYRIYYAPKFKTWINSIIPNKFPPFKKDEPRLILPLFDEEKKCFGVSARGFDPEGLRYITIMFQEKYKIFGLDQVDFKKPYFIVEGAIDSLFLKNSIAMVGADGNPRGIKNPENAIFVFDSEPRNKEIVKRMDKLIQNGYNICIWPSNLPGKDINEMYLSGLKDIEKKIKENTFSGLEASLRLASWKKS